MACKEEKERIIKEKKERIDKERRDFKDLLNQAERWNQSQFLRSYIKKIEETVNLTIGELPEEIKVWIIWAKQKADWYDPLVNIKDLYLTDEDKKNILK